HKVTTMAGPRDTGAGPPGAAHRRRGRTLRRQPAAAQPPDPPIPATPRATRALVIQLAAAYSKSFYYRIIAARMPGHAISHRLERTLTMWGIAITLGSTGMALFYYAALLLEPDQSIQREIELCVFILIVVSLLYGNLVHQSCRLAFWRRLGA